LIHLKICGLILILATEGTHGETDNGIRRATSWEELNVNLLKLSGYFSTNRLYIKELTFYP